MEFRYVAYTLDQGIVRGKVEARNLAAARAEVVRLGYKPLNISPARHLLSLEKALPSLFRVSTGALVRMCQNLATMLNSGASLLQILDILQAETSNRVLRRTLEDIKKTLDEGGSFSAAMAEHPRVFNRLFVTVVEVGEHTGKLGLAMEQMADILAKEHEAKQKAMRTLMYPIAIMGLSMVTLVMLMMVAMPPLLKVFEQMGAGVPLMTRMAIGLFNGVRQNLLNILLLLIGGVVLLNLLRRIPRVKFWMDVAKTRLPLMGSLVVTGELSRFSRAMSMLLQAGVPVATALQLGLSSSRNLLLRKAFLDADQSLMAGHGLAQALKRHPVLPTIFVQLVRIGEESNSLTKTMSDAAATYQQQLDQRLNGLLAMLEPASTLFVGGIVGFIAFSMFVPIYSGLNALR